MGFQVSQDEAIIFIRVELGDKGQEGQLLALKYETDQEMLLKSLLSDGNSKACAVWEGKSTSVMEKGIWWWDVPRREQV